MSKKVALLGLGHMGRNHAKELKNLGVLGCCADVNPSVKRIADELGVPFALINEEFWPYDLLEQCEVWDIVTPAESHMRLLLMGCFLDKEIFVEKPALETTRDIEFIIRNFSDAKIGVDYIEMAHPVLLTICRKMQELGLKPVYFLHHREKNQVLERGKGDRVVLDDLVHDLSQIDAVRGIISGKPFSVDLPMVKEAKIQTYQQLGFSYLADARAEFALEFSDGVEAQVRGSFVDHYHRQFVIVTDGDAAFYGNTLDRDFIKPMAALIKGEENIVIILGAMRACSIEDEKAQASILNLAEAQPLFTEKERLDLGGVPLKAMLENFLGATTKEDLICSLDRAYFYQKIAEEVYNKALA